MDYLQRLKWIDEVFHEEKAGSTQSLPVNRLEAAIASSATPVKLPVEHVSLFRPEHYEPGYAYPLVIWLHADGESEHDLHRVMPQISLRNYLGLSFRAPAIDPAHPTNGYHWPNSNLYAKQFAQTIHETVLELKKVFNIHDRRIYLVGTGAGCSIATKLMLAAPQLFMGAALLNGRFNKTDFQITTSGDLTGKRVLVDHRITNDTDSSISPPWVTRMWESTGAETRTVNSLKAEMTEESELLVALDRWIMEGISTAWLV